MKTIILIVIVVFYCVNFLQSQNDSIYIKKNDSLDFDVININEMIEKKRSDIKQYELLVKTKDKFDKEDIILVEEFADYYSFTVTHKSKNNYTGGAECYKVNKVTSEVNIIWHEHPMKIPEIKESEEIKGD